MRHETTVRIFLDTNVVLTGAFNQHGPSGTLGSLEPKATFLYSPHILAECDHLFARYASTLPICQGAAQQVRKFLASLRSECVPDSPPPSGCAAHDAADDVVLGSALASRADVICTYNIKHFPSEYIAVRTPLSIHRTIGGISLHNYIQPVILSTRGTVLFFGRLHHPSSMSQILISTNGTSVATDDNGFIRLHGPNIHRQNVRVPLRADIEFRLTVRYNDTDFEAAVWRKISNEWIKDVLTTGSAKFSESTSPVLFFVPNHQFFGYIQSISGLPRYVKDKQLVSALENYSLEAVTGSLDLKSFLKQFAS